MTATPSVLMQLSDALSALAHRARAFTAHIRAADGGLSGVLWKPDAAVVSEQALPDISDCEVRVADQTLKATVAGRDPGTNVAVLRLERDITASLPPAAVPKVGALALIVGTADEDIAVRLAAIRSVDGAWESLSGGTIDQRIVLDSRIGRMDEGGPVLAADGAILGIATRGATRQSLVIPASTVDKAVQVLIEKGSVERGWLGVALRPVALPETLRPEASQRVGLMIMEVGAESPAAKAGILAGDILLVAGGVPAMRFASITRQLGASAIGKAIPITLARAGAIVTSEIAVVARKTG